MEYPLTGLKVLDFSRVLSGPFAGRMLCDLGAEVVKIEPPEGDVTRNWGRVIAGIPGYYHQQNAGKRNICIDLRAEGARQLVFDLVAQADILIENYRPDVMGRLGIGYETLKEVNPALIMLSISGFGKSGPEMRRPAYAPIVHAEIGLLHRQAKRNSAQVSDLPLSVADTNASLHGLVGILSAVILRQRTGLGQHIDIAMADASTATDDHLHYDLESSQDTGPLPNAVWDTPLGPVLLSADIRFIWKLLTSLLGVVDPSGPETPLAEKIALRLETAQAFFRDLEDEAAFLAVIEKLNIAWGLVRDPANIDQQATINARGSIVQIDDRAGGTRPITQSPYRFSDAASGVRGPAPHRGEHNTEVLSAWLGMSDDQIAALKSHGILLADEETLGLS
jgi:crotonobetainyl-CoA:carnitine CoA-transferase CaiB-like acyl-CoA transferase